MSNAIIDVEGLCTYANFEVIDIVDDTNPYLALLGIDWAIYNQTIINFKKRILSFEDEEMRVVSPIDPFEGKIYVEHVYNGGKVNYIDQIYNVTSMHEDRINPTTDGNLSWKCTSSCTSDSGEALENWKNRLHEVSMKRCARVTRSLQQVETDSRELPTYESFIYTLDMSPKTCYTSEELQKGFQ